VKPHYYARSKRHPDDVIVEITALANEWYFLIGKSHHKDRDCHWHVETKWSYGHPPKYIVRHDGYILDKIEEECSCYEEALTILRDTLKEKIEEEKKFREEYNGDEW
jgi:hypothetical protein